MDVIIDVNMCLCESQFIIECVFIRWDGVYGKRTCICTSYCVFVRGEKVLPQWARRLLQCSDGLGWGAGCESPLQWGGTATAAGGKRHMTSVTVFRHLWWINLFICPWLGQINRLMTLWNNGGFVWWQIMESLLIQAVPPLYYLPSSVFESWLKCFWQV